MRKVKAGDLVRAAQNVDKKLITNVTVFDVYEGKGIDPGKKSIAIAVTLQPREKTMTDEEIERVGEAKIVAESHRSAPAAMLARPCILQPPSSQEIRIRKSIALDRLADLHIDPPRSNIGPATTQE